MRAIGAARRGAGAAPRAAGATARFGDAAPRGVGAPGARSRAPTTPRAHAPFGRFGAGLRALRREELAVLGVAATAWIGWFAIAVATDATSGSGGTPGHRHPPPGLGSPVGAGSPRADASTGTGADAAASPLPAADAAGLAEVAPALAMWTLMVAAMMLPTVLPLVRYVADVSRPARRAPMVATFVGAYLAAWSVVGAAVVGAALVGAAIATTGLAARPGLGPAPRAALVVMIVAAALWELTPAKRHALARCCRTAPIRLRGAAAYGSAAALGLRNAGTCVIACGPAMAVLALAGHPLVATVVVAALLTGEKLWRRGTQLRAWASAAGLLLAAAAVFA
ncbi:copper chaperone [Agromyces bracchium]|uniref:copper chaperone n=1 Tax=Agromyces bracchium TaxID=88376 RepID=UPI0018ACFBD3|nr:DUF2182 domain-containing protein [Agromyces bracchium]